ncbi:ribonuclease H-like domain-containing protein [Tanacetum coccineum]|uniref:Ribonuclease H-like domain-containing protein n=1 Tax=Tanacetum coccineum TaxID=301880 RepID=A0ABQ5FGH8_9ASTR
MELVNPPVCNESEPFSWDDIGEEESFITYTVNERSELIPDEELPENSTIMLTVIESFHAFSDKEVSEVLLIALPGSESTQDEGVLEDESGYTDDHNEEVEVSEDNEKEVAAAQNDEMETTAGVQDKVLRKGRGVVFEDTDDKGVKLKFRKGKVLDIQSENNDSKKGRKSVVLKRRQGEQEKKDAHGLLNNIIKETASTDSRKRKVKALVGAFKNIFHVIKKMVVSFTINTGLSLCGSTNENIDILLIEVYLLAKMSAANVVHLQQGWNCVRDPENEKEVAAAQNDEMETTAGVQDNVRRKGRGVIFENKDDKGVKLKF